MSTAAFKLVPAVLLVLACHVPSTQAQPSAGAAQRLHANALASFQKARFPEAYGRLIALADAGHAPAAELALWMYLNGPTVFGRDWDSTPEQLTAWAQLARQPAPTMLARSYPQPLLPVANRTR